MVELQNVKSNPGRVRRLGHCLRAAVARPKEFLRNLKGSLLATLEADVYAKSPIPAVSLATLVAPTTTVSLQNFLCQDGNTSSLELLTLATCIAYLEPKTVLEIGTFDGNSTLQIARNLKKTAKIHTLDLPPGEISTALCITQADLSYTNYINQRKYVNSSIEERVIQHFGDSTAIDFADLNPKSTFDFIFIDGGHSLECVKNDTEKSLKLLSPGGVICWHDYSPICWPEIVAYLDALSHQLKLVRIEGTTIIYYQAPTA